MSQERFAHDRFLVEQQTEEVFRIKAWSTLDIGGATT